MSQRQEVLSVVERGKESEWEWKIDNFSLSEDFYLSPYFKFEGESWWLELYPNGTDGYMKLILCRLSHGSPIDVEFFVSVKTTNGMKNFERRERKCFKEYGNCAIKKWTNRNEFSNRQGEFLSSGCLTILITMQKAQCEIETQSASAAAAFSGSKDSHQGDKISFDRKFLSKLVKCAECDEVVSLNHWFDHECQISNAKAAGNISESSATCNHDSIIQDLKQLLLNQEQTDVILRVKGKEFSAHKTILSARSSVFASTFRHEMKENKTGIVDIEDCDPAVFPDFLRFLYSNDTDNLSTENVFGLFTVADKYDCQDLRAKCVHFMKKNLTVETYCKALALALLHSEAELIRVATDFFIENADKILLTVEWQTFAAENITFCNELFIKYVNSTKRSSS